MLFVPAGAGSGWGLYLRLVMGLCITEGGAAARTGIAICTIGGKYQRGYLFAIIATILVVLILTIFMQAQVRITATT